MLIAKKFIERYQEGEYEYAKSHVIKINDVTWSELEDVFIDAPEFEDPEDAYYKGIPIDFNNDVVWLSVNPFICWIDDYLEEVKNEDEEDIYHDLDKLKDLRKRLDKYDGYDIYPPKDNADINTQAQTSSESLNKGLKTTKSKKTSSSKSGKA